MSTCSPDRPWGLHSAVRSDEDCPRCGWTAPGPKGDALADAREAEVRAGLEAVRAGLEEVRGRAAKLGWTVHGGDPGEALAA